MKHHKASEAMREAAAKVADRRANYAFSNCDRMGGADPETGVAECSLESRGQDCRCQQIEEDAENMAAAIRALPLPSATKAGEWRPIETAPKDGEPVLIACDRTEALGGPCGREGCGETVRWLPVAAHLASRTQPIGNPSRCPQPPRSPAYDQYRRSLQDDGSCDC
jgi:hypothetical protein